MVQFAKQEGLDVPALFIEELIDACVLECYFPDEAAAKDLLFMDKVSSLLNMDAMSYADSSSKLSHTTIESFFATANAPDHPIRNQLMRLTADSPDLFAVIRKEGKV